MSTTIPPASGPEVHVHAERPQTDFNDSDGISSNNTSEEPKTAESHDGERKDQRLDQRPLGDDRGRVTTTNSPKSTQQGGRWRKRIVRLMAVLAFVAAGGGVAYWLLSGESNISHDAVLLHAVSRADLKISVVERGNLESQDEREIICEVDDVRRDGINGTPIVWIIPNGSPVKKGDLLVELDSSPIQEQLDEQTLDTQQAREAFILAQAKYENQKTQNATDSAEAELKVRLAELELQMYDDNENGTHKLEVEEIKRAIDDVNNEILAAQANLELRRNDKEGIETLFKLGYAGKTELDRSRLDFLQAEGQYAAKINRLRTQLATLTKKQTYEREMQMLSLQGKLDTAERNQKQVLRNNEAALAQAKASLEARQEQLKKEEELLTRYQDQYDKCKIHAPQDGMVAYAVSRNEVIRAGSPVRMRQHILSLPNLKQMQVKTAVHESVLDMIASGLKATIRVDAFPDRNYEGTVHSVAVLPDQNGWMGSDTKIYETVVLIDEEVEQLKPGMTAVVEINVDRLQDVTTVPLQAVLQEDDETFCFVQSEKGRISRQRVQVGRSNDSAVQVLEGLDVGEQVVLNPMSIAGTYRDEDAAQSDAESDSESELEVAASE